MRLLPPTALILGLWLAGLLVASPALAQWAPNGLLICNAPGTQYLPRIAPDGNGGVFIAWSDRRSGVDYDGYVQHLLPTGVTAAGWPDCGVAVCIAPADQYPIDLVSDGQGGVIVVWEDLRNQSLDVYAQRVTAAGEIAPGWPVDGLPVAIGPGTQWEPRVAGDDAGGAVIVWEDYELTLSFAVRLSASGEVAPGWPLSGLDIFEGVPADGPRILSLGDDGVFICGGYVDIRLQRLALDGERAPAWPPQGIPLCRPPAAPNNWWMCSDGAGGAYVAWVDFRTYPPLPPRYPFRYYNDIYAGRMTANGTIPPGWPLDGLPVCTAPNGQFDGGAVADGRGGMLVAWTDYRGDGAGIYALRILPDGTLAPGWIPDGVSVSSAPGTIVGPALAPDGLGGAYIAYEDLNAGIIAQHLTASAQVAPGWAPQGLVLTSTPAYDPAIAVAQDGAIVAWYDSRTGGFDIYAQRLVTDGPVAALVGLVSAEALPDRVTLIWQVSEGAAGFVGSVERREAAGDWREMGTVTADGTGCVVFEDRTVEAGVRYGYRLRYRSEGHELWTAETWVEVPAALELALAGAQPNPAVGDLVVGFTLPDAAPASLEVLDVSGRRVAREEIGQLGPGVHRIRVASAGLRAGLYWLRLRRGAEARLARAVVVK